MGISGKLGSTRMAVALVVRARAAYLGLETKVRSPGSADSIPATRVISAEGSPWSVASRYSASLASFMDCMGEL